MGLFHKPDQKIGLALGGGAARGIAHIGVLKVIQELEIPIHAVAGTSVGSIIGALVADEKRWDEIDAFRREIAWSKLLQPSFSGLGLAKTSRLEAFIDEAVGSKRIEDLALPYAAVAVDIATMEEVVFRKGPIAHAARASSSVPGIFEPVIDNDRALVDGGVANNLPTEIVRQLGVDIVIAVDLNGQIGDRGHPSNLFDVSYRSFAALIWNTSRSGREAADILIEPEIAHINYHELGKADELFAAGESAARRVLTDSSSVSKKLLQKRA